MRRELKWENKITFFVLQLRYTAILLESHCSTIFFFLQYLHFTTSNGVGILGLNGKLGLHLAITLSVVDALMFEIGII